MAVIELAKAGQPINNNLSVVQLPKTQTRTSVDKNTQEFGYQLPDPTVDTATIIADFATKYDNKFYNQFLIDGGGA